MCYFVTVAVPHADVSAFRAVVPRNLHVESISNPSVLASLPKGYDTFLLTSAGCSCDLFSEQTVSPRATKVRGKRRRYRLRGWSEAKIERALRDVRTHQARQPTFVGLREDVRELLASYAEQGHDLAVAVHWYNGDMATERCDLQSGPRVTPAQLRVSALPRQTDEIVWLELGSLNA